MMLVCVHNDRFKAINAPDTTTASCTNTHALLAATSHAFFISSNCVFESSTISPQPVKTVLTTIIITSKRKDMKWSPMEKAPPLLSAAPACIIQTTAHAIIIRKPPKEEQHEKKDPSSANPATKLDSAAS